MEKGFQEEKNKFHFQLNFVIELWQNNLKQNMKLVDRLILILYVK